MKQDYFQRLTSCAVQPPFARLIGPVSLLQSQASHIITSYAQRSYRELETEKFSRVGWEQNHIAQRKLKGKKDIKYRVQYSGHKNYPTFDQTNQNFQSMTLQLFTPTIN